VFNHKSYYANIQENDSAFYSDYDLEDESLWKQIDKEAIKQLSKCCNLQTLLESTLDKHCIELEVENVLKHLVIEIRE
jgi:centrosomal protein CEP76